mmetsp:Transcript_22394/g.56991  ORF Transcript_22394/g.56991 Transcript_22394/m.56991 type:complete len:207 (+) Transcript_22394:277-897(+)
MVAGEREPLTLLHGRYSRGHARGLHDAGGAVWPPRRRHPPRLRRPRRGLLRLQRHRRGGERGVARLPGAHPPRAGRRPRRAPGQRLRGPLPGRAARDDLLPALRGQLLLGEAAQRPRRRGAAGRRRRRVPRAVARASAAALRARPARSHLLPGGRRPARGRRAGQAAPHLGGAQAAQQARVRAGRRPRHAPRRHHGGRLPEEPGAA